MNTENTPPRHIFIAGASGLVGQALLAQLLIDDTVASITAPVRKALPIKHAKLTETSWALQGLSAIDECYICLGTTIKAAGSQAAFKAIDVDLITRSAAAALDAGCKRMAVVSSLGASPASKGFPD